ncbi:zinc carboxypeptidase [Marivirga sp. S37H4]|uniref:Zinc carboxypeptidase n=1 Tax=Marivirga aurantiaca TaxID=2802615 RepID=A0A934X0R9_9BACT|nr:M14 family metallopeptidase [Marivirga aurantiaca]MBK6266828.1 zinc carboxypeptidase [Marivirga aurantiaca]
MKKLFLPILIFLSTTVVSAQEIQSPSQFLGYELGENFTRHHQVVAYFQHLAKNSEQIVMQKYGETYENRPLYYVIISSKDNIEQLEVIRTNQLKTTGLVPGNAETNNKSIVWLSYNIHGNESSSTEASMETAYSLLTGGMESEEWLKNTVVILDPCVNPDGRDRYANYYWQYGAKNYDPSRDAVEHREVWPGGRPNHYLFDLNRDWAWQTQKESEARIKAYHEWMPHIHVDFHEQYVDNPYYFAPAAEPLHEVITPWQRNFQTEIGKNHAKYFDKNNWLYFTRERFDLFYPSYGDTYPTFNGAIGMTYEQAGGGMGGLGVLTEYGDTLTLKDRIAHHYTTGMSTVEIASKSAERLNSNFKSYFDKNRNNPTDPIKAYVVKWSTEKSADINALKSFLDKQKIEYSEVGSQQTLKGYDYFKRKESSFTTHTNDLVISSYQPKSTLIQALFDPKPNYSDSLTYDITAWALPYAYGLETYGVKTRINANKTNDEEKGNFEVKEAYAYLIPYQGFTHAQLLASLLKEKVKVKVANKPSQFAGKSFDRGTLIITERNNEAIGNLSEKLSEISKKHQIAIQPITTGFADKIYDVGSAEFTYLKAPNIAVIMGDGVSSLAYGEVWHFFERQLNYPITSIRTDDLTRVDFSSYDAVILPSGYYNDVKDFLKKDLLDFVKNGGNVINLGASNRLWADSDASSLESKPIEKDTLETQLKEYANAERKALERSIFGAIYEVQLDNTHPLAYGYAGKYFSLKTSEEAYKYLEEAWNIGYLKKDNYLVSGFAGYKANKNQAESLVFGVENMGRGKMIYLIDDPLFRGFWYQGRLLFANAVFMLGE